MNKKKECKHKWIDTGLGYFIGAGDKQMFFHDPDAVAVKTHEFKCKICQEKKYINK